MKNASKLRLLNGFAVIVALAVPLAVMVGGEPSKHTKVEIFAGLWGGLFVGIVGGLLALRRRYFGDAVEARAVIKDVIRRPGPGGSVSWHPVLEFRLASGRAVVVTMQQGAFPVGLRVGRSVRIRYQPERYDHVELVTSLHWFFVGGVALFSATLLWLMLSAR